MTVQRLGKREAADQLGVSVSTLQRMVKRGDLETEREGSADNGRLWILVDLPDDNSPGKPGDLPPDNPGNSLPMPPDHPGKALYTENAMLRQQVEHLQELSEYHKQALKDSEWRYQQLLQQLESSQRTVETLSKALPSGPSSGSAAESPKRRRWWPFRRG